MRLSVHIYVYTYRKAVLLRVTIKTIQRRYCSFMSIKPCTLLKKAIPIWTYVDWDEKKPECLEADLVGHDGGNSSEDLLKA
jgi:hypothetical protein